MKQTSSWGSAATCTPYREVELRGAEVRDDGQREVEQLGPGRAHADGEEPRLAVARGGVVRVQRQERCHQRALRRASDLWAAEASVPQERERNNNTPPTHK